MPGFDVVIPNYNYGRYLRACVDSVRAQDVAPLRILIIDNASTDDSAAIARQIAAEDPRVDLRLHERNLGPHASFNEGIDWADAEYCLILCSDDLLAPGALRRAGEALSSDPGIAFCHGRDWRITTGEAPPHLEIAAEPARWRRIGGREAIERFCAMGVFQISGPTLVVRTSAQKAAGHYREELPHSDDYDVWLRLALLGDIAELKNVQAINRDHGLRRSGPLQSEQVAHIFHTEAAAELFFSREGAAMADAQRLRRKAARAFAARAYWSALSTWTRGDPGAGGLMRDALRRRPLAAILPPLGYLLARPDTRARAASGLAAIFRWFRGA